MSVGSGSISTRRERTCLLADWQKAHVNHHRGLAKTPMAHIKILCAKIIAKISLKFTNYLSNCSTTKHLTIIFLQTINFHVSRMYFNIF